MKPSNIFYSQDSIKDKFDNGYTIYGTLSACKKHSFVIQKIPTIRVVQIGGKFHTLDNRRLWVFKKLEESGTITDIHVQTVSRSMLEDRKFTTTNGGTDVIVRRTNDDYD
ncbi:Hypothetical predicted protein [Mytilus galloprovincialis]|uniref:Uncharacterized protein n=1 Tax=Mytilus galloprovincialis TaxID=29158 RepID=A0A8B6ECJ6_MYTGA|nr:Hypothetical predicted protein [Mytilus galloprovincialis]